MLNTRILVAILFLGILMPVPGLFAASQGEYGATSVGSADIGVTVLPYSQISFSTAHAVQRTGRDISNPTQIDLCISINSEESLYSIKALSNNKGGTVSNDGGWVAKRFASNGIGSVYKASRGHSDCVVPNAKVVLTSQSTSIHRANLYLIIPE